MKIKLYVVYYILLLNIKLYYNGYYYKFKKYIKFNSFSSYFPYYNILRLCALPHIREVEDGSS